MRNNFSEALNDNLLALRVLGTEVNAKPSQKEAELLFEQVKNEILAVGFDEILAIPRATDPRTDLAVALLNDAGAREIDVRGLHLTIFHIRNYLILE
jgi:hypothetical protein